MLESTDEALHELQSVQRAICQCNVSQSEGLGQTNNHNQHNKGLRKGEWWCASAVPEGKLLMGKGMLLHQRDDADADKGHS